MKKMLIASTSTIYGGEYLEYLLPELERFFESVNEVLFIPYARPGGISHDDYTTKVSNAFSKIGKRVRGLHEFDDAPSALKNAQGIFTGGGNTFLLVAKLYENELMEVLSSVISKGTPYLGTSAGSNITGISMQTTNDMPIILPPSFKTLGLIPFNLNPHFIDAEGSSSHMGESRETRIAEFHFLNDEPVLGLREGSWIDVDGQAITLKGNLKARVFRKNRSPIELEPGTNLAEITESI